MDFQADGVFKDTAVKKKEVKDVGTQHDFLETESESFLNIFLCNVYKTLTSCEAETQADIPAPSKNHKAKKPYEGTDKTIKGFYGFSSVKDEQALLDLTGTKLNSFNLLLKFLCYYMEEKNEKKNEN